MRRSQFEQAMDILLYVKDHPGLSRSVVQNRTGVQFIVVDVVFRTFIDLGLIESKGRGYNKTLYVTDKGRVIIGKYYRLLREVGLSEGGRVYADVSEARKRYAKSLPRDKANR